MFAQERKMCTSVLLNSSDECQLSWTVELNRILAHLVLTC